MFQRSRDEICRMCQETLQDNTGKYSAAKVILMVGFFAILVFMWKLLLTGALTLDFFIAFLAFISGHNNISKYLDNKKVKDDKEEVK